jgi:hypothetical protein
VGWFVTKGGATTASPFPRFVTNVAKCRDHLRTRDQRKLIAEQLAADSVYCTGFRACSLSASQPGVAQPSTLAATADGMYTVSFASAGGAARVGSEMLLYAASCRSVLMLNMVSSGGLNSLTP